MLANTWKIRGVILGVLMFFNGCTAHHPTDPNANTIVTYQYQNGPVNIVLQDKHKSQIDCSDKTLATCAIALYIDSEKYINKGKNLTSKKLYLSATVEYLQALTRLSVAKIKAKEAKLKNYGEFKQVIEYNLEHKIDTRSKYCNSQIERLRWMR